ncbi:MAG: hypothetical protein KC478_16595, partial [Bacteriovoracaceae bacterium]|nr:hypothetical protein [Bacteriovoracaceae bacterium]
MKNLTKLNKNFRPLTPLLLLFLASCVGGETPKDEKTSVVEELPVYSFSQPTKFYATSGTSFTMSLTKLEGDLDFSIANLRQNSLGSAYCNKIDVVEQNSNPKLIISDCTGDGGVIFSYGLSSSIEIHIDNTSEDKFQSPFGVDINGDDIYVVDTILDTVVKVDSLTGDRTIVSNDSTGTGTPFVSPGDIHLYDNGTKAYVIDSSLKALLTVDLVSGDRTVISNSSTGAGTDFSNPTRVTTNSTESKAYIADRNLKALFEVDLTTGDRVIISDASTGSGTSIFVPYGLTINSSDSKAYLADRDLRGVIEIELSTGNRTTITSPSIGAGQVFSAPHGIELNEDGTKLFVLDNSYDAVFVVDIATGDRTVVSKDPIGSGLPF